MDARDFCDSVTITVQVFSGRDVLLDSNRVRDTVFEALADKGMNFSVCVESRAVNEDNNVSGGGVR